MLRKIKQVINPTQSQLNQALFFAIGQDNLESVKKAIDDGADVNGKDKKGRTPLICAIYRLSCRSIYATSEPFAIIEYLIKKGADVNRSNDAGKTPLYSALDIYIQGNFQSKYLFTLLLKAKAKPSLKPHRFRGKESAFNYLRNAIRKEENSLEESRRRWGNSDIKSDTLNFYQEINKLFQTGILEPEESKNINEIRKNALMLFQISRLKEGSFSLIPPEILCKIASETTSAFSPEQRYSLAYHFFKSPYQSDVEEENNKEADLQEVQKILKLK